MKKIRKEGIPAFLSILVLLAAEGIIIWGNLLSEQQKNLEIICNILMFMIVIVSFFQFAIPSKNIGQNNFENVFSNVMISVVSFPMNIDVFGHTIRFEHIRSDIWGWHLFWMICVLMQILILSKLGEKLLNQIQELLIWIRRNIKQLGNFISAIISGIERGGIAASFIIIIGMVLWGAYLFSGILNRGMYAVLADKSFLWGSIQLWLICFFIYIIISIIRIAKDIINKENIKKALVLVTGITLLAIVIYIFPMLQEVLERLMKMLIFPVCSLVLSVIPAARRIKKRRIDKAEGVISYKYKMKTSDLSTVIFSFVWVPLNIIYISTYAFHGGGKILATQDLADFNTWLDFWKAVLDAVDSLRQLINII